MRHVLSLAAFVLVVAPLAACGDTSADGAGGGSAFTCKDTEFEIQYLHGSDDGKMQCMTIPSGCDGKATCSDVCKSALYALCASPYTGFACADAASPTVVNCSQ